MPFFRICVKKVMLYVNQRLFMVAQFPTESENLSTVDSLLIPKLDIFLNIEDVGRTEIVHNDNGLIIDNIPRHGRVVEIRISAKGIQVTLRKVAIMRIFNYATHAIINDMNITTGSDVGLPLNPYTAPTNNPRVNITINVDRSKRDKTVDLELIILNLEANCITETFNKLSTYLEEAVTTDLNPSI